MNSVIRYLSQVDFIKVIEQTIPLVLTGISVLLFYYLKKRHDNRAKEKETRFGLYEDKKLQTIVDFITHHNTLTITLEKGFHMTSKIPLPEQYVDFGNEAFKVFSDFYQSYFSLTFFLTPKELTPFEKIYLDTSEYFKSIKETLKLLRHNVISPNEQTELQIQRDKMLGSNRENVRIIGNYFRTFLIR